MAIGQSTWQHMYWVNKSNLFAISGQPWWTGLEYQWTKELSSSHWMGPGRSQRDHQYPLHWIKKQCILVFEWWSDFSHEWTDSLSLDFVRFLRRRYRTEPFLLMWHLRKSNNQSYKSFWLLSAAVYIFRQQRQSVSILWLNLLRWFMTGFIVFDLLWCKGMEMGICCLQCFMKEQYLFKCLLSLKRHCVYTCFWHY